METAKKRLLRKQTLDQYVHDMVRKPNKNSKKAKPMTIEQFLDIKRKDERK